MVCISLLQGLTVYAQNLSSHFKSFSIPVDDSVAYNQTDLYVTSNIFTAQVAKWKDGYIVSYVNQKRQSKLFFTDAQFRKTGPEVGLPNRIIFQLVTDNNEIALLTGSRDIDDGEVLPRKIYFTKINVAGKVVMDKYLLGSTRIEQAGHTELDDWGSYLMQWTGNDYLAFFPIQHNFSRKGKPDIHQADCAYLINPDGKMSVIFDWGVSHSFGQALVANNRYAALVSRGDAYPRGLNVNMLSTKIYELEDLDGDEIDPLLPHIKTSYYSELDFECTPFEVSGREGNNYIPFHLGDAVFVDSNKVMTGFTLLDKRTSYDIGIVVTTASDAEPCSTNKKFITQTQDISEHSMRMTVVGTNRILVLWKAFNIKTSNSSINKVLNEYEDSWDDEIMAFQKANPDRQMAAIINFKGDLVVKPIALKKVNWYNTVNWHEDKTLWHDLLSSFANHTYSPIISGLGNQKVWIYHRHGTKELRVFTYSEG